VGLFSSDKIVPIKVPDLGPVGNDVIQHFRQAGFETAGTRTLAGGWDISLTKGGLFKSVIGSKTALKIEIEPGTCSTEIKAGIGIFGLQAIPTAISAFLFWPIIVTQIAGMVQQANLDTEAITVAEDSLRTHAVSAPTPATPSTQQFCVNCGAGNPVKASFCSACGTRLPQAASSSL
jgi:zinc-ribbon domain